MTKSEGLWKLLAECFGADSLARKFGDRAPDSWVYEIDQLSDFDFSRGMKRLKRSGKATIPSLPEFLRLCREVNSDQFPDEQRIPATHQISGPQMQRWDREANLHLLSYITKQAGRRIYYADKARPHVSQALTQPLVDAKNAWSEDMRDAEIAGNLPPENGLGWFTTCMKNAEAAIAIIRADNA